MTLKMHWGFRGCRQAREEQLPQDSWRSIRCKFQVKETKFGYFVGETVGWQSSNKDVPQGSWGTVVGFDEDTVEVKFASGAYLFPPNVLNRVGEEIHGFRLGDSVTWTSEDEHVPYGCVGTVIGPRSDVLIADFGARTILNRNNLKKDNSEKENLKKDNSEKDKSEKGQF